MFQNGGRNKDGLETMHAAMMQGLTERTQGLTPFFTIVRKVF